MNMKSQAVSRFSLVPPRHRSAFLLTWLVAACGSQPSFTDKSTTANASDAAPAGGTGQGSGDATAGDTSGRAAVVTGSGDAVGEHSSAGGAVGSTADADAASAAGTAAGTAGAAGSAAPSAPAVASTPPAGSPSTPAVVIPPVCDPNAGATQAMVKSTAITASSITIVYRIYRTTCAGVVLPLTADSIAFDVDAAVSGFTSINYRIAPDVQTPGSSTQNGTMQAVVGSDLFGDIGNEFAHWATRQPVTVISSNDAVDLTISTGFLSSRHSDGLHTYLEFGAAAPITVVVPMTGH